MANITEVKPVVDKTTTAPIGKRGLEILTRIAEIADVERTARKLKDEKSALTEELDAILGGAYIGLFHGAPVVSRVDSHSDNADLKKLLSAFPEAYTATVKRTEYHYYK